MIFLVMVLVQNSHAQVLRNVKEATDDKTAIKVDRAQLDKDMAQLEAFKNKIAAIEEAFANKKMAKVKSLKQDIMTDMRREIEQSERKITQDEKELVQSRSEVNSSRREVRRSRRDRVNNDGDVGEGRDLRDDRRISGMTVGIKEMTKQMLMIRLPVLPVRNIF